MKLIVTRPFTIGFNLGDEFDVKRFIARLIEGGGLMTMPENETETTCLKCELETRTNDVPRVPDNLTRD